MTTNVSERTQVLLRCLESTGARHFAADVLASECPSDASRPLAQLLDNERAYLRVTAVTILAEFAVLPRSVYDRLMLTAKADRNLMVRALAAEAVQGVTVCEEVA